MEIIQGILTIWIMLAGLALIVGGRNAAGKVISAPVNAIVRGMSWMVSESIRTIGSAIVRIISDIHNYCYSKRPGLTVVFYLTLITSAVVLILFYR